MNITELETLLRARSLSLTIYSESGERWVVFLSAQQDLLDVFVGEGGSLERAIADALADGDTGLSPPPPPAQDAPKFRATIRCASCHQVVDVSEPLPGDATARFEFGGPLLAPGCRGCGVNGADLLLHWEPLH